MASHKTIVGCMCAICEEGTRERYRITANWKLYNCWADHCTAPVTHDEFYCCFHYWNPKERTTYATPTCTCDTCKERTPMTIDASIFPGSSLGSFLLYRDGSFQCSFNKIEDAKAAAQQGLLNAKGSVFVIFEASVKITAKPIETVETDLRPAKPEPVVAG